ncbi:MAG: TIGR03618 family F420-dependent PPOX class oxidoreductase [Actinomycetota bacterium]
MRKDLGIEGLGDLVELPIVATLATYRKDGTVLLSPVWHEWHDGGFNVTIERDDVKARHVKRDPRASLALYEDDPPYRGLELRGTPKIIEDGAADIQRRIALRYLGAEAGEAYASTPSGTEVTLRLEPGELRTWDFAEDF